MILFSPRGEKTLDNSKMDYLEMVSNLTTEALAYSPPVFTHFLLGTFIAVIAGWLANIYYKISMHGLAIGGMLFFVINLSLTNEGSGGQYISAALLIAGLTATARLLVSDHKGFDVYSGIFVGAACQAIALAF